MKTLLGFIMAVCMVHPLLTAQTPDTYWYGMNGEHVNWYFQKDVFAFRIQGGQAVPNPFPVEVVSRLHTPSDHLNPITVMEFAPGVPDSLIQAIKAQVALLPGYECEFEVVSPQASQPNTVRAWSPVEDEIMVTFRDPYLGTAEIDSFCARHWLALERAPLAGLVPGYSHSYLFSLKNPYPCQAGHRAIDVCREVWEQDSGMVMIVEANLVMAFAPTSNDSLYPEQWHIRNTGQGLAYNQDPGTPDADHDIDRMWAAGYKGQGMRVAVVDLDGFDLGHEDMQGAFLDPWDAIGNAPLLPGTQSQFSAHGMCVAGIIGARADNQVGLAGVAPECSVVPIQVNGQTAVLASGIQRAMVNSNDTASMVHVLNISLGSWIPFQTIRNELMIAKKVGRNGLGMVIVAAAGNVDADTLLYPAAWPETISAMGSNPADYRKTTGDQWDYFISSWGSGYNTTCDVAAGCCLIWATDHSYGDGYNRATDSSGNYIIFNGTSGASPIVAGVCAMLLQNNPSMVDTGGGTWQVRDAIRAGAEKTHPSLYDYNAYPLEPGRSLEMAFGRLNGYNSLLIVGMQDQMQVAMAPLSIYCNSAIGVFKVFYILPPHVKGAEFVVTDLLGRPFARYPLTTGQQMAELPFANLAAGIYLGHLESPQGRLSHTVRFVNP